MNFDISSFVLGFVFGIVVFLLAARAWINATIKQFLDIMEAAAEKTESAVVPLKVELENDQYLCYDCNSKEFVCQGRNVDEIIDRFKQRYPDANAFLKEGDESVLSVLREQLKQRKDSKADSEIK